MRLLHPFRTAFLVLALALSASACGETPSIEPVDEGPVSACGDGSCDQGETCASCASDCGGACCTPTTCEDQGKNCDAISDGCGGSLSCGSCTAPQTCGGGGVPNVCGEAAAEECSPTGTFSVVEPLVLSRTSAARGETVTARVTYQNKGCSPVRVARLVVAVRDPGGAEVDMTPEEANLTVASLEEVELNASLTLSATAPTGTWRTWDTWQDGAGEWYWSAEQTITVTATPQAACGNGTCGSGETCSNCAADCGTCPTDTCGDAACNAGETCTSCPADCGTCPTNTCGNGTCGTGETCSSCAADCGLCPSSTCGNGTCGSGESCLTCAGDCGACPAGTFDVWTPRPHNAQFVMPGGRFLAEVRAPSTLASGGWSAAVKNELRTWGCTVSAVHGKINHGAEDGWRLTITVPAGVPPELFELRLAHATAGSASVARSVQVVRDFEESFYALHQTDQHLKDSQADNANGTSQNGSYQNGSLDGIKWGAKSINLINPRFVIITGDNGQLYNNATSWDGVSANATRLELYKQGLAAYRMATLATTGNHCIGFPDYVENAAWKAQYAKTMGQRAFSYRLGSFYMLFHEWTQADFVNWATSDYAAAYSDPAIKFRLLAQHFGDARPIATASNPAHLKVVGHNHKTSIVSTSPYPVLSAPSAQFYQESAVYEFKRTATGWTCPQATAHAAGVNVFRMHGDWGAAKVSDTWQKANDGTQTSNSVTVSNSLAFNFWNGRVKFLMAKGRYVVTGGTVEATYDNDSGTKTAVLVKINIPKSGSVTASIAPATTSACGNGTCGTGETCSSCPTDCGACCVKTTCSAQGKNCGSIPDGCGGTLSCGGCTAPETCGGGGVANVCGAGASMEPAPLGPAAPAGGWRLVWHDEFDDSTGSSGPTKGLAASKWNSGWWSGPVSPGVGDVDAVTQPVQSGEMPYYGPSSLIFPGDGSLHLRMQKGIDNGGSFGGRTVQSGMINTAGLMNFNPARVAIPAALQPYSIDGPAVIEVRMRIPGPNASAGSYWPVIWMTNAGNHKGGSVWPGGSTYSEEIDLIEWWDSGSLGVNGWFHTHAASEYDANSVPSDMQNTDLSLAYHTYTYALYPTYIKAWVDGKPITGLNPSSSIVSAQWKYPQYLMIAFQSHAGGLYPTGGASGRTDMMIDYVRIFQE